jgi:signal transduction histidine kinase
VFRKTYAKVFFMLVFSTMGLLFVLGLTVFGELRWQLSRDGEAALQSEVAEVGDSLAELHVGKPSQGVSAITDDRGQNVFFAVMHGGQVVLDTANLPVPVKTITPFAKTSGFSTFEFQGRPYRLLSKTVLNNHTPYQMLIFTNIEQERHTIERVNQLMIVIGIAGLILSVAINLRVAGGALGPARRTWRAYQDSMVELSHELQTPLATARAILDSRTPTDPRMKADIQRELDRASEMVRNILFLSHVRSDYAQTNHIAVAVSDVTEDAIERFIPLAAQRGIKLSGSATQGLFVETTFEAWDRLVSTILKNVVDHAAAESTATWSLQATYQTVRLVVKNTVVSKSPMDDAGTVGEREPFVRGFGLRIIQRLVSEMNGKARMQNEGTTVSMIIHVPRLKGRSYM